jgi:hypothetical protein
LGSDRKKERFQLGVADTYRHKGTSFFLKKKKEHEEKQDPAGWLLQCE